MPLTTTTTPFGIYTTPANPTVPIPVTKFTLTNTDNGFSASIIDYSASVTNLIVPNALGELNDVVLGFDTLEDYLAITSFENPYFGATIGRTSNRIRAGKFTMDGKEFQLTLNDGSNHLHGGFFGFGKIQSKASIISGGKVAFSYVAKDGEEGYPSSVLATVTYTITQDNELVIDYAAMADGPTPIYMTNHSYFNLTGHQASSQKLLGHSVQFNADNYTPIDPEDLTITGEVEPVQGTKYDLRNATDIHDTLNADPTGYDINLCINRDGVPEGQLVLAGRISTPNLSLEIHTNQPGVQFYTGNFLPETALLRGKESVYYYKHGSICVETQSLPDSVNHSNFPNVFYTPGQIYQAKCVYKFVS